MTMSGNALDRWLDAVFEWVVTRTSRCSAFVGAGAVDLEIQAEGDMEVTGLVSAFPRLEDASDPDLTITIPSGLPEQILSDFPHESVQVGPRGRVMTKLQDGRRLTLNPHDEDASLYFPSNNQAIWVRPPSIPEWHYSSPFRQILHWHSASNGRLLIHSALVGDERGAIVIAGPSFAGKSTATALALRAGFKVGGDDYVEIDISQQSPLAFPIYRMIKLREDAFFLPEVSSAHSRHLIEYNKTLHYLDNPTQLFTREPQPIVAILILTNEDCRLAKIASPEDAVMAIAPSTLLQSHYDERPVLNRTISLCSRIPIFKIPRLQDEEHISQLLNRVLDGSSHS